MMLSIVVSDKNNDWRLRLFKYSLHSKITLSSAGRHRIRPISLNVPSVSKELHQLLCSLLKHGQESDDDDSEDPA